MLALVLAAALSQVDSINVADAGVAGNATIGGVLTAPVIIMADPPPWATYSIYGPGGNWYMTAGGSLGAQDSSLGFVFVGHGIIENALGAAMTIKGTDARVNAGAVYVQARSRQETFTGSGVFLWDLPDGGQGTSRPDSYPVIVSSNYLGIPTAWTTESGAVFAGFTACGFGPGCGALVDTNINQYATTIGARDGKPVVITSSAFGYGGMFNDGRLPVPGYKSAFYVQNNYAQYGGWSLQIGNPIYGNDDRSRTYGVSWSGGYGNMGSTGYLDRATDHHEHRVQGWQTKAQLEAGNHCPHDEFNGVAGEVYIEGAAPGETVWLFAEHRHCTCDEDADPSKTDGGVYGWVCDLSSDEIASLLARVAVLEAPR